MARSLVFISHATEPLDNEFALWLTARLTALGYDVWCDLGSLLGGEHFDADIQAAIEQAAVFLYVLTDASNIAGPSRYPANELIMAREVARQEERPGTIIPLQIAPLKERVVIGLQGLTRNQDFLDDGWASGLRRLVRRLEGLDVPKPVGDQAAAMAARWHLRYESAVTLTDEPESLRSNWFPAGALPRFIHVHEWDPEQVEAITALTNALPYPAVDHSGRLFSFATLDDLGLNGSGPGQLEFSDPSFGGSGSTRRGSLSRFQEGAWPGGVRAREARTYLLRLIRGAWNRTLEARGLQARKLNSPAGERTVHWFPDGFAPDNRAYYRRLGGKRAHRQLCGVDREQRWHLGLGLYIRTEPLLLLEVRPHIYHSDDGHTLWDDAKRAHKRSRSLRRSWHNDKWRDLLHAAFGWLSDEQAHLALPLSRTHSLLVRTRSLTFESPVGYATPRRDPEVYVEALHARANSAKSHTEDATSIPLTDTDTIA